MARSAVMIHCISAINNITIEPDICFLKIMNLAKAILNGRANIANNDTD
jgi:hypothetical protein